MKRKLLFTLALLSGASVAQLKGPHDFLTSSMCKKNQCLLARTSASPTFSGGSNSIYQIMAVGSELPFVASLATDGQHKVRMINYIIQFPEQLSAASFFNKAAFYLNPVIQEYTGQIAKIWIKNLRHQGNTEGCENYSGKMKPYQIQFGICLTNSGQSGVIFIFNEKDANLLKR